MEAFLEFEKPIAALEKRIRDLRDIAKQENVDFSSEITILEKKVISLIDETYAKLTPWQRVQLSRHPNRPYTHDYIDAIFPDFMELHGDRTYSDDQAIITGIAHWPPADNTGNSQSKNKKCLSIAIIGHQKGRTTKQKMERNFGMARPDGYRKAMRIMMLAERFMMPILTFIDTPGAYPGLEAEERGQSQAIAESIHLMFKLNVPVLSVVIGEGGSGGALAIGVANTVLMQEYSTYSVISPESCASILWSDSTLAERASERLKMTSADILKLGVVDGIVPEPKGGAHRDWSEACRLLSSTLVKHLEPLLVAWEKTPKKIASGRIAKFRGLGLDALAHVPLANMENGH
ncbi:MAG: acetyl-CoA carboxylase carboxyltransferase subunit alpha [Bdellovibrionota bacterium]